MRGMFLLARAMSSSACSLAYFKAFVPLYWLKAGCPGRASVSEDPRLLSNCGEPVLPLRLNYQGIFFCVLVWHVIEDVCDL